MSFTDVFRIGQYKSLIYTLENENKNLEFKLQYLEEKYKTDTNELSQIIQEMQEKINLLSAQNEKINNDLTEQLIQLNSELDKNKKNTKLEHEEYECKMQQLIRENGELSKYKNNAKSELEEYECAIEQLIQENDEYKIDIQNLYHSNNNLTKDIEQKENIIEEWKVTIKQLLQSNEKLSEYKKDTELEIKEYESTIKWLNENLDCAEKIINDLSWKNELYIEEIKNQNKLLTDDHGKAYNIRCHIEELNEKLKSLEKLIEQNTEYIQQQKSYKRHLESQIIELDEKLLLQDFALYEPSYYFDHSEEYKEELNNIRRKQKAMIKNKTACFCPVKWTISGKSRAGQKLVNDSIKQTLITFNIECENAMKNVKFYNFDSMKERIQKMYDKLNMLNSSLNIQISREYYYLKIDELGMLYEYEKKKQEEKEYLREQRAIQKENEKVEKELEEERKRITKEQLHYKKQLQNLNEQIEYTENQDQKNHISNKIADVKEQLSELDDALTNIDYRRANERAGYVYIISNIGSFGEGIYKIGMTRRLEPTERIDELGNASVPFKFDIHALIFSADAPSLETTLHQAFADYRVNKVNNRKEFYKIPLKEIEKLVKQYHDKTVTFEYIAPAEQYRETLKINKSLDEMSRQLTFID